MIPFKASSSVTLLIFLFPWGCGGSNFKILITDNVDASKSFNENHTSFSSSNIIDNILRQWTTLNIDLFKTLGVFLQYFYAKRIGQMTVTFISFQFSQCKSQRYCVKIRKFTPTYFRKRCLKVNFQHKHGCKSNWLIYSKNWLCSIIASLTLWNAWKSCFLMPKLFRAKYKTLMQDLGIYY